MRGYRARRAARQAKALARGQLRAVAVDGKTCRGARRADGTRVRLPGVAVSCPGSGHCPALPCPALPCLPWRQLPAGVTARETGHGHIETRTVKAAHVSRLDFPHASQAIKITRWRQDTGCPRCSGPN